MRHPVRRHLHTQVAAGNHDAVRSVYDFRDVLDGLGAFDLRQQHDAGTAVVIQKRAQLPHARRVADKRRRHEIDLLLDTEQQVLLVLLGHGRQRYGGARNVDGLALAKRACVAHGAVDVGAFDGVDRKLDHAVVHKDGSTGLKRAGQTRAILRHDAACALHVSFREREALPRRKLHGLAPGKQARANLGALRVKQDSARAGHLGAHAAQTVHTARVLLVRSVAEVEAGDVHARRYHCAQLRLVVDGRPERADDLRSFCHGSLPWRFRGISFLRIDYTAKRACRRCGDRLVFDCFACKGSARAAARFQRPTGRAGCSTRRRAPACRLRQRRTWPRERRRA